MKGRPGGMFGLGGGIIGGVEKEASERLSLGNTTAYERNPVLGAPDSGAPHIPPGVMFLRFRISSHVRAFVIFVSD